jgi:hypothetical protein
MLKGLVKWYISFLFFEIYICCILRSVMDNELRECNPWMIAVGGYMSMSIVFVDFI